MADDETLKVYADKAQDYAEQFANPGPGKHLRAFMDDLTPGGRVLDLGCGPGQAAAEMLKAGFDVEAWDASAEMAQVGRETFGVAIHVKSFNALDAVAHYDGIYANFSLLHLPKVEMPSHLARIAQALVSGGVFHLGLKSGTGEARDALGRFYAYYKDDELTDLLATAGLSVTSRAFGKDIGLAGTEDPWVIMRARKND